MKNIVMIMCDQLRKDCIGAFGNEYVHTPNIDRLINGGLCFDRGYVANPICMPNRNSIISGRMPSNHEVWTNGLIVEDKKKAFTYQLKEKEYMTANIGKMHLSPCGPESAGLSFESKGTWTEMPSEDAYTGGYFGYDHVELTVGHTSPKAHYYKWFLDNGGKDEMFDVEKFGENTGIRKMPSNLCSSTFIGVRSEEYIKNAAKKDKPFFLTASFPDPHLPFTACYDDYERYKDCEFKKPIGSKEDLVTFPQRYEMFRQGAWGRKGTKPVSTPDGISDDLAAMRIRATYAMIERIDINVGKIIKAVEDSGLMDNTIFIFTSDHGELLGDHGLWKKGPFFYEGLVNVPFVFYGKGIRKQRTEALISSIDIAPTICELCGAVIPDYMDGISQAKFILGMDNKELRDCCLIEYRNGYGKNDVNSNVLITKNYKYVMSETGEAELIDLFKDKNETTNVADAPEYRDIRCRLTEKMLIEKLRLKSKGDVQYGLS